MKFKVYHIGGSLEYDEYELFPKITAEWTKQLIHDIVGSKFHFESMQMYYTSITKDDNLSRMVHIFNQDSILVEKLNPDDPPKMLEYDIEVINLSKIYDPINMEIHYIGYGEKSNRAYVGMPDYDVWKYIKGIL